MDALQTALALAKLGQYLRTEAQREGTPARLSPTQIMILRQLDRGCTMGVTALAAELGVTQPTVSDAIAALRRKRLVTREPARQDGRVATISLTAAGAETLRRLTAVPVALTRIMGDLPLSEKAALQRVLIKIIKGLQDAQAIPVQRMCVTCAHFRPFAYDDPVHPHHCRFVDSAFGDDQLRVYCGDHRTADNPASAATTAIAANPAE
ncbi:MAG: MarR family winged helix-turn-helix transcriptional regulator [Alphaproteobacteria bacterium]